MCECVKEANKALEQQGNWKLSTDILSGRVMINTFKHNGVKVKQGPLMAANYCPLCGVKYEPLTGIQAMKS